MKLLKPLKHLFPALLALASIFPLYAQQIQISKDNKTIAITTTDEASALADTAVVTIGFNAYGKDQDTTYADATQTSNAIISAITTSGIPKDAIQSQEQNLTPLNPGNNQDKVRYDEGLRFQFSQRWQVTLPADQASNLLQLAITHGANNRGGIDWQLKNDDVLQAEAAQKALHHAREIADHMAQGLNTHLGSLLYASNQVPEQTVVMEALASPTRMARDMKSIKPLAISPDRITRSATVYAVFAIE